MTASTVTLGTMLPVGRTRVTLEEVEAVFATNQLRRDLWAEFADATAILRASVRVRWIWLAGSYFTDKPDPDDVDCTYWIEDQDLVAARADPVAARVIETFSQPGLVRGLLRLRVDAYVVPWTCNPLHYPVSADHDQYYRQRGYWDDLWLRTRSGAKGAATTRADALPRRGYLEVVLDDFDE